MIIFRVICYFLFLPKHSDIFDLIEKETLSYLRRERKKEIDRIFSIDLIAVLHSVGTLLNQIPTTFQPANNYRHKLARFASPINKVNDQKCRPLTNIFH